MTKKQFEESNKKPIKSKKKQASIAVLIGIFIGAMLVIAGRFLDKIASEKWNVNLVSRGRRRSGGIVIILCSLLIIASMTVIVLKSVQYKQKKIDVATWKTALYGSLLTIIIMIISLTICILVAVASS